jgi:ABC-type antimicrobial peptide transport system permease subunit
MIKNYFKIAWRNIARNKLHSFINVTGLAVAFSICSILFLMAFFQLSYDSFHTESKQLFKTTLFTNSAEGGRMSSQVPTPLMPVIKEEIAGIEAAARIQFIGQIVTYKDKSIERMVTKTDPDFLTMFTFPVLIGNPETALTNLQSVALTKSTSDALFGKEDPIGKQVDIGKNGEEKGFIVSAIMQDCPRNSSIRFEVLTRIETGEGYQNHKNQWDAYNTNLFVKIANNSSPVAIENKLTVLTQKYFKSEIDLLKTQLPAGTETGELLSLNLKNIEEVHFSGERSTPLLLIYAIIGLGAFILLIACFNFVNLNLAKSFKRSREVGVRKSLGALKFQLFGQLWGEAVLLYSIGFIAGILLAYGLIPVFNANFDTHIELASLFQPTFLAILLAVFFAVTLIAGGYPALRLSGIGIIDVLKGKTSNKRPGLVRNSLLVGQFAISGLLICVSLIAGQQLDFLRSKPIGFEKEQVISIPVGTQLEGRTVLERMRNELANDPSVVAVSGTGDNLGRGRDRRTGRATMDFSFKQAYINATYFLVDHDFLKTLTVPIRAGRDFNNIIASSESAGVIVSESFVKAMGEENPVGKFIGGDETSGWQIVGVVPDFSLYSPVEKAKPFVLHQSATDAINYIFVKVESDAPDAAMTNLATAWGRSTNDAEFKGSFLDENLQSWYEGESFMTQIFGLASGVAIMLSCLGLFALSLIVIELRTKEIGLRKVMGASVKNIVAMVSFSFLKLILISLLISLPIAWFAMSGWLENYADRITINPLIFIAVGVIITAVALITVSYHTIKAAVANPVNSLRSE